MRIATFNVENLFSRSRAMNLGSWDEGKNILDAHARLNKRFQEPVYSEADKLAILEDIQFLGLSKKDESAFAILRQNHGHLLKRHRSLPPEVVATGRNDWIGWLALKTEAVDEVATRMIARVIQDVNADILGVVEAEDRVALCRFNDQLLKPLGSSYKNIMLIDGNDDRGIDVGLMTKSGYEIESIVSHVDDMDNGERVFSRDCPEFTVCANNAEKILILINHFKSKGFGSQAKSNARRKAQARRVREIYEQRKVQGNSLIAVLGDFNDTPESDPLQPLLGEESDLRDIFTHPLFKADQRSGTYGNGAKSNKIDYLLLSPDLYQRVSGGGVWRKGVWGGKNGTLFPHYDEMTAPVHGASDHAAVWADIT